MDGKTVNLVLDYCLFDLAHIISDKPNSFKNVRRTPSPFATSSFACCFQIAMSVVQRTNVHLNAYTVSP